MLQKTCDMEGEHLKVHIKDDIEFINKRLNMEAADISSKIDLFIIGVDS